MSDDVQCEVCKKEGRRRRGTLTAKEFFYAEATMDDAGPEATIVLTVCSEKCALAFFKPGPGKLDLDGNELPPAPREEPPLVRSLVSDAEYIRQLEERLRARNESSARMKTQLIFFKDETVRLTKEREEVQEALQCLRNFAAGNDPA